jgi:predicted aspartyl protease
LFLRQATMAVFSLVAILGLTLPTPAQEPAPIARAGEHHIPVIFHDGAVFIHGSVNGKSATLLLDTGAAQTTLSFKAVPDVDSGTRITVNIAKGSVSAFRLFVGLVLGDSKVKDEHCSFRQSAVVGDFKFGEADGVVGLDVLSSFKSMTLDFKRSVLILEDR